jgi:antitoxin component YwqK of YwqJK toxin-antitoxin module
MIFKFFTFSILILYSTKITYIKMCEKNLFFLKSLHELKVYEIEQAIQLKPLYIMSYDGNIKHIYYYRSKLENGNILYYYQDYYGIREGEVYCFYENGKLFYRTTFINDQINGKFESFYTNGQKYILSNYKNGILHGTFYEYFYNSQLLFQEEYKDGKLNGKMSIWSYDGKKRKDMIFENHILKSEKEYINNLLISNKDISIEESNEYHRITKINNEKNIKTKGKYRFSLDKLCKKSDVYNYKTTKIVKSNLSIKKLMIKK